ncbi:large ribosomal subunit protein uL2m-like [Lineus longissimus]|uniref:large ribosomal subunit protein uL2m-like n=1 Tax=Lineus longissimus TaxID=88925 RepID=UPI002B4C89B3
MAVQMLSKCLQRMSLSTLGQVQHQARMISSTAVLQKRPPMWYKTPPIRITKLVEEEKYTVQPIKMNRFAGRDEHGHRITRRGGGNKRRYRLIDWKRRGNDDGSKMVEKVIEICYDPNRSANIALVAQGEDKRYIIATENMKKGDLIKSSSDIPRMAVKAFEGDSHPLGALPIGTLVNSVERWPGTGGRVVVSAGVSAILIRKVDGRCIVKLPSKQEINVDEKCAATVGRVGNVDHNKIHYGKAGAKRWAGFRPRSGLWQRKDARYGRRNHGPKPVKVYDKMPEPPVPKLRFTGVKRIKTEREYYA